MVPRVVLMKSGLVLVNIARQVNTAHSETTVNAARPMSYLSKTAHSTGKNVNTAKPKAVLNAVKGNQVNAVKASACWGNPQIDLQDQGVIDSGCSRHMTWNMSYLIDYEEIDGGYVAFGGNPKGGKITGKCTIKTVPRKNNMYSVDLKNIVSKGGLTCLFTKATSDESKLWHRRLGHLNIKTMNKLVKGNLVRGLPSKLFENDQTCVACQKGKQHRASCKSKTENSIKVPLHLLHMDLFGPTFVKILMNKMYCLVVIDDYSRFTWVFFLTSKDETSGILKSFITGIEDLVDHKVKVIRCDNKTEFKNREMNQFCKKKGILRQFSAEAVNTTCYVQNKVFVVKPHNKTPYELFHGRTPTLSFMRPFGCLVIILNTIDHLDKFDGKADEGFFVGYSLNNKAFRVFNSRTRIVEENLHIRFSESTPNVVGSGPDWLFDIDALTRIMNYEPIVARTQSNGFIDTKASDNACQAKKKTEPKVDKDPRKESECNDQEKEDNVNNTNNVNTAGTNEVNVVGGKTIIELAFDPNMSALEDYSIFNFLRDDEGDGAVADMNNLDTTIKVIPILTIRIHKNHPLNQMIGDLQSATQTRKMSKNLEEHGFISTIQQRTNHKDLQNCLFACFLSQEEPKKIKEEVYVCQPPGFEDPDFPNRVYKVEKALYDIKLLELGIKMSSMGELTFFLGLQVKQKKDGIFISQAKYVDEILKKFGFIEVKTASTLMEPQKPLLKDENGEEVDVHMYRSMIGSLMYFTSSRPNIMFAVCACARYQVNPNVSHLHTVKRIFRYLKGQPNLGLWYPKDSLFDLVAYTDSDYAGVRLDRKSTIGGLQQEFWSTVKVKTLNEEAQLHALVDGKKIIIIESSVRRDLQLVDEEGVDCLSNSTIFEQLTLMGYKAIHKELGDNLVKAATTASSLEAEHDSGNINKTQSKATPNKSSSLGTTSGSGLGCQETMGDTIAQTRFESVSKHFNDSLLGS
ncbi:putative ribonuclease H-like domain-containing protein [Tanacetum coccineum]